MRASERRDIAAAETSNEDAGDGAPQPTSGAGGTGSITVWAMTASVASWTDGRVRAEMNDRAHG